MRSVIIILLLLPVTVVHAQKNSYNDSIEEFRENYIANHEVVTGDQKAGFVFYSIDEQSKVVAHFEPMKETKWISMETSSGSKKTFRIYGYAHFKLENTPYRLTIYQPQSLMNTEEYKDYLFIPFADESNEDSSYEVGRYIDLRLGDIIENEVIIDFNKAYNPYCAYVSGKYNCPIPLKENFLEVRVDAGEKRYKH